ncbi:MAG: glycosyltransferase family 4 protein [Cytophagales bacterium]|nr:glycosyltransferase family 4 protein [Rhizobacter sp.]
MTIFYICPWAEKPTGGIKQIFRHVEALSDAGFDAYVLALESDMPSWFMSSASVARVITRRLSWIPSRASRRKNRIDWLSSTAAPLVELRGPAKSAIRRKLDSGDILVLPEYLGSALQPCGFRSKLVVFNQNAHYTFTGFSHTDDLGNFIYRGKLLAALAVSNHTFDYLKYSFPELRVLLTPNGVDGSMFFPSKEGKKRQIAFMPRKLPSSIVQVLQILRGRGSLKGWDLCPIDGLGEAEVARMLRESAVFMSTCHDEGFGLPPLEAGASGCVVVGYTGYAAREFMLPEHCYPIAQGDVLGFAQTLEKLVCEFDANPGRLLQQAAAYSEFLQKNYSKDRESKQVVAAWNDICPQDGQRRAHQG